MSICYRLVVEVEGVTADRQGAVIEAVGGEWEFNTDYPDPEEGTIRFTGYADLPACAAPRAFAGEISRAIWRANGGYCPVRVDATREDEDPGDEFEFGEDDYLLPGARGRQPSNEAGPTDCPGCGADDAIPAASAATGEEAAARRGSFDRPREPGGHGRIDGGDNLAGEYNRLFGFATEGKARGLVQGPSG